MGTTVPTCSIENCDGRARRRGWCDKHYSRWWNHGDPLTVLNGRGWVNPLVCVCSEPDADPARNFGMCDVCFRKPLALMAVPA